MDNDRVYKFRGKRIDNGEWIYGYFLKCEYGSCIATDKSLYHIDGAEWNFDCVLVIPESVGQFIGIHYKNGDEIYEHDIVCDSRNKDNGWISEIVFSDTGFCFEVPSPSDRDLWELHERWRLKKIGNSFTNKELLYK